jgi:5-methylcytosine-specific restriction endonuclease McrA
MYKVEKICSGDLKCEKCGFDPIEKYPDRSLRQLSSLMDVDHINPNIKHTLEGEQPNNYQLLCKHCHVLKSHDEGDYQPKKLKK